MGADLIDRSGRIATLTTAGEAALEHARAALRAVGAVRRAVDDVTGLMRGRLVVGMVTGCSVTPLFDALAAFHHAHPGVDIALVEDSSDRLIEAVTAGSVNIALAATAGAPPATLASLPIVSEGLVAAVPAGHLLAGRAGVTLTELSGFPIVCLPRGTGVRTVLDLECAGHGVEADVALECSAPDAVVDLAARGLGVAVLSESMAAGSREVLESVPITGVDVPAVPSPDEVGTGHITRGGHEGRRPNGLRTRSGRGR